MFNYCASDVLLQSSAPRPVEVENEAIYVRSRTSGN